MCKILRKYSFENVKIKFIIFFIYSIDLILLRVVYKSQFINAKSYNKIKHLENKFI